MKLRTAVFSLVAALMFPAVCANAASPDKGEKNREGFSKAVAGICKNNNAVGMSMAVFKQGKIIYTINYGFADRENKVPATKNTKYRAASISKPVTAIGAMMLAEQGKLNIDAPISGITGINLDNNTAKPNTTRHLMTHTSTIGDTEAYNIACNTWPFPSLTTIKAGGNIFTASTPGARYEYSNFAAGLVAAVIESVTKQRFHAYMDENVFKKLNLDAGYTRDYIEDNKNIANIYQGGVLNHVPRTWTRTRQIYDVVPLGQQYLIGQCEMIISAPELAKIGMLLAGDGSVDGVRILSGKSIEQMHKPYISDQQMHYSIGLRINDNIVEGRTITGHPGQALGMVGGLYFDRADETGVAILTNGCSIAMQDNGVYRINNELIRAAYKEFFAA